MQGSFHRKIYIRTDANPAISGGHVMRCLSLADALAGFGADVEFVLSDEGPVDVIGGRGFAARVLGTDWRELAEGSKVLCGLCDGQNDPVVLVDTYAVTSGYVDRLSPHAKVCYLGSKGGDLGSLSLIANYSTDVDEGFYGRTYGPRGTRLLLGPGYAPLGARFNEVHREREGSISRVLVTTGSTDPFGFLPAFLAAVLDDARLDGVGFDVVVGGMVADDAASTVERIASESRRVDVMRAVSDMADLMARCDAAVSANGTTVYELAAAGLPTVAFSMVEEQVASAESLARLGAIEYCGPVGEDVSRTAAACIDRLAGLASDPVCTAALARRAHGLIDGLGAEKIAKEIMRL
ncbi:MAG: PseG/SpsG family protein [Collinsella sp.]